VSEGNGMFDLTGKVAVILGGGGALGSAISCGLLKAGAQVAITNSTLAKATAVAGQLRDICGHVAGYELDILQSGALEKLCDSIYADFGKVDTLVNCVGGNLKEATTSADNPFFDISTESLKKVMDLNFLHAIVRPCQVFGKRMLSNPEGGSIINISSMTAAVPLTRIVGYSAAKAAVDNFTKWFAVYLARECKSTIRVNAIAPGFFLTQQNEFLLTINGTSELTERGKQIINHTPMGAFGNSGDLAGTAVWLASDASRFVTGTIVSVDGGFSAYAGV